MAADKKKFWDKIADKYSRDPVADPQSPSPLSWS